MKIRNNVSLGNINGIQQNEKFPKFYTKSLNYLFF